MRKMSASATLKGKHHKHACLPVTRPSKDWAGVATAPCPEVKVQHEPAGDEPVRQQYQFAVQGSDFNLPKKV